MNADLFHPETDTRSRQRAGMNQRAAANDMVGSHANFRGLGPKLDSDGLSGALKKAGLDWSVRMVQEKHPVTGAELPFFAVMREDTQTVFQTGLTKRYHPIQNDRAFNTSLEMSDATGQALYGAKAQSFNHGSRSIVQVDMGAMNLATKDGGKDDIVFRRLTFLNNHTGGGSVTILCTPFRGTCNNGMAMAVSAIVAKIAHTATAEQRLRTLIQAYALGVSAYTATEEVYRLLARTPVSKERLARYLETLLPSTDAKGNERDGKAARNTEEAREAIADYWQDADGGYIERETGWNAMNAATRHFTHDSNIRIHGDDRTEVRVSAARTDSIVSGTIAQKNALALKAAITAFDLEDDVSRILKAVETSQAAQLAAYAPAPISIYDIEMGQH